MFKLAAAIGWAALVGVSVPLEVWNQSFLNRGATDKTLNGIYFLLLAALFGSMQLLPLAMLESKPWGKPSKCWYCLGGVSGLVSFINISASVYLGVSLLLMTQLLGLLGTFFIMDVAEGSVKLRDRSTLLAVFLTVLGVMLEATATFEGTTTIDMNWLFHFVGAFLSGVSYALQAKVNGMLAQDVGSPIRAALICGIVTVLTALPVAVYVRFGAEVKVTLDRSYWPLWLVAGFQSAFYIASMARLPKLLGFTANYTIILGAKLIFGMVIDAVGLAAKVVSITWARIGAVFLVFIGASLFNFSRMRASRNLPGDVEEATPVVKQPGTPGDVEEATPGNVRGGSEAATPK